MIFLFASSESQPKTVKVCDKVFCQDALASSVDAYRLLEIEQFTESGRQPKQWEETGIQSLCNFGYSGNVLIHCAIFLNDRVEKREKKGGGQDTIGHVNTASINVKCTNTLILNIAVI